MFVLVVLIPFFCSEYFVYFFDDFYFLGRTTMRLALVSVTLASVLVAIQAISYRCENHQVLIVQSFGNDTIRMHCQRLDLCGNKNLVIFELWKNKSQRICRKFSPTFCHFLIEKIEQILYLITFFFIFYILLLLQNCNYDHEQPSCGGKNNFVSHVNQVTPTGP